VTTVIIEESFMCFQGLQYTQSSRTSYHNSKPEIVYTEPPKDIIKDNMKKLKEWSRRKRSPKPLAKRTPSTFRQKPKQNRNKK
jgi:hypothetical protein